MTHHKSLEKLVYCFTLKRIGRLTAFLEFACAREFGSPLSRYSQRVLLLNLKTRLGEEYRYWKVLFWMARFFLLCREKKLFITSGHIWDLIIPLGSRAMQLELQSLPSHAGKFRYPIPELFTWENALHWRFMQLAGLLIGQAKRLKRREAS